MKRKSGKKVGILGGTFDPIHFGHIHLAVELKEAKNLDEVWLCPAWQNPLKPSKGHLPIEHRIAMVKLATQGVPGFQVIDFESKREGPSYTVETLRELKAVHPENQFFLLMGEDVFHHFNKWQSPEEIKLLAELLVGKRGGVEVESLRRSQVFVAISEIEISSTQIRNRIKKGQYCGHLVPKEVLDYISEHRLYL